MNTLIAARVYLSSCGAPKYLQVLQPTEKPALGGGGGAKAAESSWSFLSSVSQV